MCHRKSKEFDGIGSTERYLRSSSWAKKSYNGSEGAELLPLTDGVFTRFTSFVSSMDTIPLSPPATLAKRLLTLNSVGFISDDCLRFSSFRLFAIPSSPMMRSESMLWVRDLSSFKSATAVGRERENLFFPAFCASIDALSAFSCKALSLRSKNSRWTTVSSGVCEPDGAMSCSDGMDERKNKVPAKSVRRTARKTKAQLNAALRGFRLGINPCLGECLGVSRTSSRWVSMLSDRWNSFITDGFSPSRIIVAPARGTKLGFLEP